MCMYSLIFLPLPFFYLTLPPYPLITTSLLPMFINFLMDSHCILRRWPPKFYRTCLPITSDLLSFICSHSLYTGSWGHLSVPSTHWDKLLPQNFYTLAPYTWSLLPPKNHMAHSLTFYICPNIIFYSKSINCNYCLHYSSILIILHSYLL